jgi:NADH:ubiquinone oxidoreductase subunit 4 (subunit M)
MYIFISLELQELYMVPFLLYAKRLKEILAYSSLAHVTQQTYTPLLMDYVVRLQMIAHGFVVVGLFSSLTSF